MKNLTRFATAICLVFVLQIVIIAQEQTIILFRHAEKDASPTADKKNPNLSDAGQLRANKLLEMFKDYKPQEIFSTIYNRTRATVTPLAIDSYDAFRLQIQIYDSAEPETFAKKITASTSRCILVVGHSNTIPALANILLRETKYKDLADNEYNKIWIFKIKKAGKKPYKIRSASVIEY